MIDRIQKLIDLISTTGRSRMVGLLVLVILVAAIPLTVFVAQQQQEVRQRAQECPCGTEIKEVCSDPDDPNSCENVTVCKTNCPEPPPETPPPPPPDEPPPPPDDNPPNSDPGPGGDCTPGETRECTTSCPSGKSGTCGGHKYCDESTGQFTGCVCETSDQTCRDDGSNRGCTAGETIECETTCPSGKSGTCGGHRYCREDSGTFSECQCETSDQTCKSPSGGVGGVPPGEAPKPLPVDAPPVAGCGYSDSGDCFCNNQLQVDGDGKPGYCKCQPGLPECRSQTSPKSGTSSPQSGFEPLAAPPPPREQCSSYFKEYNECTGCSTSRHWTFCDGVYYEGNSQPDRACSSFCEVAGGNPQAPTATVIPPSVEGGPTYSCQGTSLCTQLPGQRGRECEPVDGLCGYQANKCIYSEKQGETAKCFYGLCDGPDCGFNSSDCGFNRSYFGTTDCPGQAPADRKNLSGVELINYCRDVIRYRSYQPICDVAGNGDGVNVDDLKKLQQSLAAGQPPPVGSPPSTTQIADRVPGAPGLCKQPSDCGDPKNDGSVFNCINKDSKGVGVCVSTATGKTATQCDDTNKYNDNSALAPNERNQCTNGLTRNRCCGGQEGTTGTCGDELLRCDKTGNPLCRTGMSCNPKDSPPPQQKQDACGNKCESNQLCDSATKRCVRKTCNNKGTGCDKGYTCPLTEQEKKSNKTITKTCVKQT